MGRHRLRRLGVWLRFATAPLAALVVLVTASSSPAQLAQHNVLQMPLARPNTAPAQMQAAEPDPPRLSIPVVVTDDSQHRVEWLSANDFALRIAGDPQKVAAIRHGRDEGAAIGIMADVSITKCPPGPFHGWKCTIMQAREMTNLLALTLGGANSIFLAAFARHFHLIEPYTSDRSALDRRIPYITVSQEYGDEGTALYDNMIKGVTVLAHGPSMRRALVMVTDGKDEISWHGVEDVIAAAQRAGVVVYVLMLGQRWVHDSMFGINSRDSVMRICAATGGRGFLVGAPDSISRSAQQIAADIDNQYLLEFTPPSSDGAVQSVELFVRNHPGMSVRAPQVIRLPRGYPSAVVSR